MVDWTDPANQVVWGWVERYHVGIGGCGENMRVRVEDRKEAWELVPERTCQRVLWQPDSLLVCSECGAGMTKALDRYCFLNYCPNCGAKVVE